MSQTNLKQQKIKLWQGKLVELEKRYNETMLKRGEATLMGDLSENAAFSDADEQAQVLRKRIADVKMILKDLEKEED